MKIDTLRSILYEISVIFLIGVVIAVLGFSAWNYLNRSSMSRFTEEYDRSSSAQQVVVAERYLKRFPASALMSAVEEKYSTGVCHVEGHPVGRAVYKSHPSFSDAIRQCGSACTYGCFHGVLMEMFDTDSDTLGGVIEEQSPEEYLSQVKAVAKDLCTRPEVESVVRTRYCYHGLGHVFASMGGTDLKSAIDSCGIFSDRYVADTCRSGAFMEYLLSTSSAPVYYTKDERPCDAFPLYKSTCYRYKAYGWIDTWGSVEAAFQGCAAFGKDEILCIRSVAQAVSTRTLIESTEEFEKLCGSFVGEKRSACVDGAIRRNIELNNGDDSGHSCDRLDEPFRTYCVDYTHAYLELGF